MHWVYAAKPAAPVAAGVDAVVGDVDDDVAVADFVPPAPQPAATKAKTERSASNIIGLALTAEDRETGVFIT